LLRIGLVSLPPPNLPPSFLHLQVPNEKPTQTGLLIYRLYRYRREFHRLIAARNTTSSRFIRLFILSLIIILFYATYSIYLLVELSLVATDPYSWSSVHDPTKFSTILRIPMQGKVQLMSWVQVATGYVLFVLFGTGVDAHNLYKRMLVSIGCGKIWPSLYIESGSGARTPNSFIAARTWTSHMSSRAKSMLWSSKTGSSTADTYGGTTRNNSVVMQAIPHLKPVTTRESHAVPSTPLPQASFFSRVFTRRSRQPTILPFSHENYRNIDSPTTTTTDYPPTGVQAHAWAASEDPSIRRVSEADGVHVIREVHQDYHNREDVTERDFEKKTAYTWV
jgi:pheromone a factor receptor